MGSLREELKPLDIVVPDQLFDRTKARPSTFFGDGVVVHMGFADPFCPHISQALVEARARRRRDRPRRRHLRLHRRARSSRRAPSRSVYRQLGLDIIGMTNLQEAKLAREAELCYATMALVTDYDVWYEGEEDVTLEQVLVERAPQRRDGAGDRAQRRAGARPAGATAAADTRSSPPSTRRPISSRRRPRQKLDLLIGKYVR